MYPKYPYPNPAVDTFKFLRQVHSMGRFIVGGKVIPGLIVSIAVNSEARNALIS